MKILEKIKNSPMLQSIVKEHLENNNAVNAPYHNFYHHLVVANSCEQACDYYLSISDEDRMDLIVAAMWHDFNHSMGKMSDEWNVGKAIESFLFWCNKYPEFRKQINQDKVKNIILATQYPYIIEVDDLTLLQKIIRDADLTQVLQNNRIQQVYLGLITELSLSFKTFFNGQIKFTESVKPCTGWFAEKWEISKNIIIEECDMFLTCLDKNE